MINYYNRTAEERALIDNAYRFEKIAIENFDSTPNPYTDRVKALPNGKAVWEAINEAVEMAFHN